jgi:hypothetical protein
VHAADFVVTLYTKPSCHLCEDLLADLHQVRVSLQFDIVERNINDHADDFERFQYLIPVLGLPDGTLLFPPHDLGQVRETISSALRSDLQQP